MALSFHQTEVAGIWMNYLKVLFKQPSSSEDGAMFHCLATVSLWYFLIHLDDSVVGHCLPGEEIQEKPGCTWERSSMMLWATFCWDTLGHGVHVNYSDMCHRPKSLTAASSSRIRWPFTWSQNSPDPSPVEYLQDAPDKQVWSMKAYIDYRP